MDCDTPVYKIYIELLKHKWHISYFCNYDDCFIVGMGSPPAYPAYPDRFGHILKPESN